MAQLQYFQLKPDHEILCKEFLQICLHDPTLLRNTTKQSPTWSPLKDSESLIAGSRFFGPLWPVAVSPPSNIISHADPPLLSPVQRSNRFLAKLSALSSHFTCTHSSPFLQMPLAPLVGPFGMGEAAKAILQGTFVCPPGVDEATRQFIKALQFPSLQACQAHILAILRPEDFIQHWKQAKEHTSSLLSGLYFRHYRQ